MEIDGIVCINHRLDNDSDVVFQWHLGFFEKEYTPTYRGFDSYYGFWNGKEDYWDHSSQEDVWGNDLRNNEEVNEKVEKVLKVARRSLIRQHCRDHCQPCRPFYHEHYHHHHRHY